MLGGCSLIACVLSLPVCARAGHLGVLLRPGAGRHHRAGHRPRFALRPLRTACARCRIHVLSRVRSHRYLSLRAALLLCVVARISRATPYSAVQHAPPVSSGFILFLCRGPGFGCNLATPYGRYYTALSLRTAMAHICTTTCTCVCPSGHSAHCRRVSDTTHRACRIENTKLSFIRIRTFSLFCNFHRRFAGCSVPPSCSVPLTAAGALPPGASARPLVSAARRRVTSVHSRERMPASSPAHEPPHQPPTRAHHRRPRRL